MNRIGRDCCKRFVRVEKYGRGEEREILQSSAFRFLGNASIARVRIMNEISRRTVT
jgi:hypothetical protein